MAGRVRTWVWVVVGIVAIGFLAVVGIAAAGFYFFTQHIETRAITATSAASEFDSVRSRFSGQKALIELDERGRFVRSNAGRPASANTRPELLNVMVFDPDDGRIVRIKIPFWLLRMKLDTTVDFNGGRMKLDDLKLTVEDLERLGPVLIVDHATVDGERVLVWSQ
jgi:hypothetical protein